MGLLLRYGVGITKNAFILLITQPVKCFFSLRTVNVRRRLFWVFVMVFLFIARDVTEYYCGRPEGGGGGAGEGQIGKAVAFGPDRVLFISPNFVFTI